MSNHKMTEPDVLIDALNRIKKHVGQVQDPVLQGTLLRMERSLRQLYDVFNQPPDATTGIAIRAMVGHVILDVDKSVVVAQREDLHRMTVLNQLAEMRDRCAVYERRWPIWAKKTASRLKWRRRLEALWS